MPADLLTRFQDCLDLHQCTRYRKLMDQLGWQTLGQPGNQVFVRRLGPLAIAKLQRPQELDPLWLKELRRQHHLLITYVEPGLLQSPGTLGGLSVEPFAHSKTSLVDLTQSEGGLLSSFKQKTRYNITHSLKDSSLIIQSHPLAGLDQKTKDDFYALHHDWSKRKKVYGYDKSLLDGVLHSFQGSGWLHLAYHQDSCIAALLVLQNKNVATYYAAFSSTQGYSLYAPTLLTWKAMTTAQAAGCTIFDFGGIYDARYPQMYKKWQGFTKFKEGFCPTVATYPKTKLLLGW